MGGLFKDLLSGLMDFLGQLAVWMFDIAFSLADGIARFFIDLVPQSAIDYILGIEASFLWDSLNVAAYALPVYQCLAIYAASWPIIYLIRAIRFAIGFIPTIEG